MYTHNTRVDLLYTGEKTSAVLYTLEQTISSWFSPSRHTSNTHTTRSSSRAEVELNNVSVGRRKEGFFGGYGNKWTESD